MLFEQLVKSRTIWGAVVLVVTSLFGAEIGGAADAVVGAAASGVVPAILTAAGGLLVVIGRIFAKPIVVAPAAPDA